ncbi:hypothetical protein Tco_1404269 [Tanacetum coccineum]
MLLKKEPAHQILLRVPGEFAPKGVPCVFLGYPAHQKAYKLYNLITHSCSVSGDVQFHHHIFSFVDSSSSKFLHRMHVSMLGSVYDDPITPTNIPPKNIYDEPVIPPVAPVQNISDLMEGLQFAAEASVEPVKTLETPKQQNQCRRADVKGVFGLAYSTRLSTYLNCLQVDHPVMMDTFTEELRTRVLKTRDVEALDAGKQTYQKIQQLMLEAAWNEKATDEYKNEKANAIVDMVGNCFDSFLCGVIVTMEGSLT